MKCEWQDCAGEGTNPFIRNAIPQEQESFAISEGYVISVPRPTSQKKPAALQT